MYRIESICLLAGWRPLYRQGMGTVRITRFERSAEVLPAIEEVDRLMDHLSRRAYQLWAEPVAYPGEDADAWFAADHQLLGMPAAEVADTEGNFRVTVPLPCFVSQEIDVTAGPGDMVIRAEAAPSAGRPAMKVMRRFQFPAPVLVCEVQAAFAGGNLVVVAPRQVQIPAHHA